MLLNKNKFGYKIIKKKVLKIILFVVLIIIVLLLGSFLNHRIRIRKELEYLQNYDLGKIIEVDNKKINYKIFNENNTKRTILLIGGSGATDLSLSFNLLAQQIEAKIVLINRYGYGLSDDVHKKASVENIVDFYRNVLKELNITEEVFLMPHSIGGMYAMYWSLLYPNEIEGIIGLDIGSPYMYVKENNNKFSNNLSYIGSKLGFHRYIYKQNSNNTAIKNYDIYSKDYFQAIWNMNMINPYSRFNLSEENLIKRNANKVIENMNDNYYNMKKLYIIANFVRGDFYEKYEKSNLTSYYKNEIDIQKYIENVKEYQDDEIKSLSLDNNTSFVYVEGPHILYYYPTDKLVKTINEFLES